MNGYLVVSNLTRDVGGVLVAPRLVKCTELRGKCATYINRG